jgi:hypothetical protein
LFTQPPAAKPLAEQTKIFTELEARSEITKRRMRGEGCAYSTAIKDAFLPGYVKKLKQDYPSFDVARLKCDLDDECKGITQSIVDVLKVIITMSVRASPSRLWTYLR